MQPTEVIGDVLRFQAQNRLKTISIRHRIDSTDIPSVEISNQVDEASGTEA